MLPMLPRRPILLGGLSPLSVVRLLHSVLGIRQSSARPADQLAVVRVIADGVRNRRGIVVSRQERVGPWQHLPFAVRAGIEAPG